MSQEAQINPIDPNFVIELKEFAGPLDLLLHLIQKHELQILDLPIAFVTEKYLAYLNLMEELNLDIASEYLLMAATLAHIKSKMLLPSPPVDQDEGISIEEQIDPREALIKRLLEYQKYKLAAEHLGSRNVAGRDVFVRTATPPEAEGPAPLAEIGLYKLLDAFQSVLKRAKMDLTREISAERVTIQDRIAQITHLLTTRKSTKFEDLFETVATRYELVVTFLAILEMAKMRLLRVYQADAAAPLHIEGAIAEVSESEQAADLVDHGPTDVSDENEDAALTDSDDESDVATSSTENEQA